MPRIHEYQPQQNAPGPVNIQSNPNDFGEQAYRGASQLGSGLEDAGVFLEKRATQGEVSDIHAKLSGARAKFTQDLQEGLKTADPGDKEFAQRFIDNYDKQVSEIQGNIQTPGGQNFFERANENLRTSLLTSAVSGQVELAGIKASNDALQSINLISDSIMRNPPSWESGKEQYDAYLKDSGLSTEAKLRLDPHARTKFAEAAVEGWAQTNPAYAKQLLQSDKYDKDINSDQKEQLFGRIKSAEMAERADAANRLRLKQAADEAAQEKTKVFYQEQIFNGTISAKEILMGSKLPEGGMRLDAAGIHTYLNYLDSQAHTAPGFKEHSPAFSALHDRLFLPDGDPNKIVNSDQFVPYATNQRDAEGNVTKPATLSPEDMKVLNEVLMGKKTQDGSDELEQRKALLDEAKLFTKKNPMSGETDPQGPELTRKAQLLMIKDWNEKRKAGVPWTDLIDRDNKNYVGNILKSPAFQRSAIEILNDNMAQMFPKKGVVPDLPQKGPPGTVRMQFKGQYKWVPEAQVDSVTKDGGKLAP